MKLKITDGRVGGTKLTWVELLEREVNRMKLKITDWRVGGDGRVGGAKLTWVDLLERMEIGKKYARLICDSRNHGADGLDLTANELDVLDAHGWELVTLDSSMSRDEYIFRKLVR